MKKKEIDTAMDWATGKLTHAEVCRRLQVTGNTAYSKLARALKYIHYETK